MINLSVSPVLRLTARQWPTELFPRGGYPQMELGFAYFHTCRQKVHGRKHCQYRLGPDKEKGPFASASPDFTFAGDLAVSERSRALVLRVHT